MRRGTRQDQRGDMTAAVRSFAVRDALCKTRRDMLAATHLRMNEETAFTVARHGDYCVGRFTAMASPCEVLVAGADLETARRLTRLAVGEARRIEQKFSRYRDDNIVAAINRAAGQPVAIDSEVHRLLAYADTCYKLSGGKFDITSGVLRRVWKFDGSDRVPAPGDVAALLPRVGWQKVRWNEQEIMLPVGMELDFGGIGKEYAVDRTLLLLTGTHPGNLLVNFGGDLATNGALHGGREWTIGVEAPGGGVAKVLKIRAGAMTTSGDARRFLIRDGVRYGHILDPRTGWPVPAAPRSVTVVGRSCLEAGTLSTLAILEGAGAEKFLQDQGVQYWILY